MLFRRALLRACLAPLRADAVFGRNPTSYDVGCILSPLRGCRVLAWKPALEQFPDIDFRRCPDVAGGGCAQFSGPAAERVLNSLRSLPMSSMRFLANYA